MATVAGFLSFHLILAHRPRGLHVPSYLKVGLGREFCVMTLPYPVARWHWPDNGGSCQQNMVCRFAHPRLV